MKQRRYSQDFKNSLVELVKQGHSANSLSNEYEVSTTTILQWVRDAKAIDYKGKKVSAKDYLKAQKEITHLKEEIRILKQAAVLLGQR